MVVAGTQVDGPPLHHTRLTGGPGTLLVIPDEEAVGPQEDWQRLGGIVEFARVPVPPTPYRYRLIASIVLAEVARQLGARADRGPAAPPGRRRSYDSALLTDATAEVDLVSARELCAY